MLTLGKRREDETDLAQRPRCQTTKHYAYKSSKSPLALDPLC